MDVFESKTEEKPTIELGPLFDVCANLENIVGTWIKDNAIKQAELKRLQKDVLQIAHQCLDHVSEEDLKLRITLEALVLEKQELEIEAKQHSDINDKLSSLVAIAQNASHDRSEAVGKTDDYYLYAADTITTYEQITDDFSKLESGIEESIKSIETDSSEQTELLEINHQLVIDINKNSDIIKLLEQQNKYAEQQFELILNELPWDPLSDKYLKYLTDSNIPMIRDMGHNLSIQTNEISDLTESLNSKKERKLKFLEDLATGLELFMRRRAEASLISRFTPQV